MNVFSISKKASQGFYQLVLIAIANMLCMPDNIVRIKDVVSVIVMT